MAFGVQGQRQPYYEYMGPGRWVLYCSLDDEKNKLWESMQGGDGDAAFKLGMYFLHLNVNEAYRCFRAGERVGNANCILMLADMHRTGCACLYDGQIAITYYKRALKKRVQFNEKCADALAQLQKAFPEAEAERE